MSAFLKTDWTTHIFYTKGWMRYDQYVDFGIVFPGLFDMSYIVMCHRFRCVVKKTTTATTLKERNKVSPPADRMCFGGRQRLHPQQVVT